MVKTSRALAVGFVVLLCVAFVGCQPQEASITASLLPNGTVGQSYSYQLQGDHVSTWSLMSGVLPQGIQLNSAGTLSGTPTLAGTFQFYVQATPTVAYPLPTLAQYFSLTIVP
jgi:hypothetical protein